MRRLNKKQHEETLKICAEYFKTKRNHQAGKEAYLKIGDKDELMKFHVALEKWDEANLLGRSDPDLRTYLLLPYAEYLAKNNQFEEAQKYYNEAGRADLALKIMERLSAMSMLQNKFDQAGYFYWVLAKENVKEIKSFVDPNEIQAQKIEKFKTFIKNASIYKAYQLITEFIHRPLKVEKYPGYNAAVYNSARLILGFSQISDLEKVSLTEVNYVFAKTAVLLGGKKAARVALEKLN